jgi:hypothetical protein
VNKFSIRFDPDMVNEEMAEALPDENHTSGIFCIFPECDDNFT